MTSALPTAIAYQGFAVVPGIFGPERMAELSAELDELLLRENASVLRSRGQVYGIRNLVAVWPSALAIAREAALRAGVGALLGPGFGLVRSIFFDKPPGRTWSLPWHRDLTIAVRDLSSLPPGYGRPTIKAGVPHVEAPESLLERMLTARVALDEVVAENGPLLVIPGSHLAPSAAADPVALHMRAGDVLLIRPLVLHRSGRSRKGTTRHRRTLHFEFAAAGELPAGLAWQQFDRI